MAARDEVWPSPEVLSVGPAWRARWGVMTFTVDTGAPERFHVHTYLAEALDAGVTDFLPILKREGDGTVYGFEPDGRIVSYDEGVRYVEDSQDFADLVVGELAELQERHQELAALLSEDPSLVKERFGRD